MLALVAKLPAGYTPLIRVGQVAGRDMATDLLDTFQMEVVNFDL